MINETKNRRMKVKRKKGESSIGGYIGVIQLILRGWIMLINR